MHPIQFPNSLDTQAFLNQYWQKKPLYLPQAWPDFKNPFPADELAGLAIDESFSSRIIEQHSATKWSVRQGPFSEADFKALEGKKWSLLVTDIEKHLPDFRAYVESFKFIPDWRFDDLMISYAPQGGSVGPHMDDYDVFLIQAEGERNWQIEKNFRELPLPFEQSIADTPLRLIKDFKTADEILCQAGDMLYLPPRLGHYGVAHSEHCMTWSIGFKSPSLDDFLADYLEQFSKKNEHKRFIDPKLIQSDNPGEITPQHLTELKQWFIKQIEQDDETFARWMGQFLSRDLLEEPALASKMSLGDHGKQPLKVEVNPFVRFGFIRLPYPPEKMASGSVPNSEALVNLYVGGEEYKSSLSLAKQLSTQSTIVISNRSKQDIKLLQILLTKGHLIEADSI